MVVLGLTLRQADANDERKGLDTFVPNITVWALTSSRMVCLPEAGGPAYLHVLVQIELGNARRSPIVIARQLPDPASLSFARSEEEGLQGRLAARVSGLPNYSASDPSIPRLVTVDVPEPKQLVRLLPGERFRTTVYTFVSVAVPGGGVSEVTPGARYWIEFPVRLWPFHLAKEEEIRKVREAWRPYGELVTGQVSTGWIPLTVPPLDGLTEGKCLVPPWKAPAEPPAKP